MELDLEEGDVLLGDGTDEACPQDLSASSGIFDFRFHPSAPFFALGLVSGDVEVHEFRQNETRQAAHLRGLHSGGVTGVEFSEDGKLLVSVSSDRTINVLDCATQKTLVRIGAKGKNPHKHGISTMNVCTEKIIATGDDDGLIALWDITSKTVIAKYHEHGDYVSNLLFFSEVNQLISSSGDTCLGAFDLRRSAIIDFSIKRPDELNCLAFIPATNDVICGTPSGELPVWRYGSWERPYDVFSRHPKECEAIETYNDNIMLTGACDTVVRVIQVHPVKRVLTSVGGHQRKYGGGISRLRISHDRALAATSGQDQTLRFVDISFLQDEKEIDKLRSKAEQRHMETIRAANAEEDAKRNFEMPKDGDDVEEEEESDWTDTSADSDDGDDDANADGADEEAAEEESDDGEGRKQQPPAATTDAAGEDGEPPVRRATKRARVAASKWLKEAQKEKINFTKEQKKKRVKGFWGDLV